VIFGGPGYHGYAMSAAGLPDSQNTQAEVMQTKAKQRKKINTTKQTQTQRAKKPLISQHKHQKSADESTQS
jgi:adenosylmethionine-8-amino-7-oxononanoate aminotransferase